MKVKAIILLMLFFNAIGMAQQSINMSYNESIDLGKIEDKTQFLITSPTTNIEVKGDKINSYKFEKPGIYHIKVIHNEKVKKDDCEQNHLPNEIIVNVSRIKMTFVGDRMTFSRPIIKNKETNGTTLSIPIQIKTFDHEPIQLNIATVNSADIGTGIIATLSKNYNEIVEGEHTITYNLRGSVHENSYLMFDFIDANGKIQPVALQTPITN